MLQFIPTAIRPTLICLTITAGDLKDAATITSIILSMMYLIDKWQAEVKARREKKKDNNGDDKKISDN